jgi:arsenate reductase (thioredoxin)
VHPEVVTVMRELGIDLTDRRPQRLTTQLAEAADVVVTMGCADECPYLPGKRYLDWELPTPKAAQSTMSEPHATRSCAASTSSSLNSTRGATPARSLIRARGPDAATTRRRDPH